MQSSQTRAATVPDDLDVWDIDRLIPSARNARTHSDQQITEIAQSIASFGFMTRVLVDSCGVIIAGHARVLAAQQLQLQRIPVVVVSHLSDAEKRAYAIADNQIALHAGWSEERLRVELEALQADGIDLAVTGFDEHELNNLIRDLDATELDGDEEAVPQPLSQAATRCGDIWRMGPHRLLCGDATHSATYTQLLDKAADMVFTDPPYNVNYQAPRSGATIQNDALGRRFGAFLQTACTEMLRQTNGALYICMSSSELHTLQHAFSAAGGHWSTFLIWAKSGFTLGRADYQRQYEPILYGWREGGPHYWCGRRNQGDVWLFDKPRVNDLHPTMKPVALIEQAICNSSRRGEVVLDPFAGSGSTLIACEKAGRVARVVELAPEYCDVIVRRWESFTGKEAVLERDGLSFEQVSGRTRETALADMGDDVVATFEAPAKAA